MPIYEYQCNACRDVQEIMQKVDAPAPESCERCGKGPLVKLMSKTGFILKGGGWYVTDFRGGSSKKPEASGDSKASESKTEPAAKTESKSESKSDSGASSASSGPSKPAV